jgi:ubiquinone/menaquinone biosynthesis C-methylase UbiE
MAKKCAAVCFLLALCTTALTAQTAPQRTAASAAEMKQAQHDIPLLADVLELKPGMTVADIGAGMGQMTIVLSSWIGSNGRVYATDIGAMQLTALRDAVSREHLENVTVIEGGARSTNLPDACCDAIFLRDVYHHVTEPEAFDRSLIAALKPGGRLAIIDFPPSSGSKLPEGVPENRKGHGVPPEVVASELSAYGLTHVKTISVWPPDTNPSRFFLVLFRKP